MFSMNSSLCRAVSLLRCHGEHVYQPNNHKLNKELFVIVESMLRARSKKKFGVVQDAFAKVKLSMYIDKVGRETFASGANGSPVTAAKREAYLKLVKAMCGPNDDFAEVMVIQKKKASPHKHPLKPNQDTMYKDIQWDKSEGAKYCLLVEISRLGILFLPPEGFDGGLAVNRVKQWNRCRKRAFREMLKGLPCFTNLMALSKHISACSELLLTNHITPTTYEGFLRQFVESNMKGLIYPDTTESDEINLKKRLSILKYGGLVSSFRGDSVLINIRDKDSLSWADL